MKFDPDCGSWAITDDGGTIVGMAAGRRKEEVPEILTLERVLRDMKEEEEEEQPLQKVPRRRKK